MISDLLDTTSPKLNKIAFIGMGGLGREVLAYIKKHDPGLELLGYFDDEEKAIKLPYLGNITSLVAADFQFPLLFTIATPEGKEKIYKRLAFDKKYPYLNYGYSYSASNIIGRGSIICPGVIITADVKIADFCLINLRCTIGHNVTIGNFSSLMPGANISGDVTIGKSVLVGTGAQILQGIHIGDNAKIGAGAVVTKDVKEGTTVVGVPAKIKNKK